MITKLSISLPQSLETFARHQVRNGGYGSISEYFRELIRIDQRLTEMRRVRKDVPRESALQRELDRVRHGR
jgi:antitoxin ParD1/3/4